MVNAPPDPTDDTLPDQAMKGRGAVSNRVSRYFKEGRQRTGDGWDDILKWQLDSRHRPCNLVELMPRLMEHLKSA